MDEGGRRARRGPPPGADFAEAKGITREDVSQQSNGVCPVVWLTSLFHEYVGRGVRLRMEFAFVVASSPEDAPLRVDGVAPATNRNSGVP